MKKINVLFIAVGIAVAGFMSSCSKDKTNDASIGLIAGSNFVSGDKEVAPGASFKIKWSATSSTDMASVSITKAGVEISGWNAKEIKSASKSAYSDTATIEADLNPGSYKYAVVVYDKDDNELARTEFVITVKAVVTGGAINTFLGKVMGGSTSSNGSYLDAETGTVYITGDLTSANKPLVDIIFDLGKLYNSDTHNFTSGTGTKFKATSISTADFDALTDDSSFAALTATDANIAVNTGSVVFFQTVGGKKGLIKVVTLSGATAAGNLTIDIKVQK